MKYKQPPPQEEVPFQIAPMIDIVFQLLIFFLMTFKLVEQDFAREVSLPIAANGTERKAEPVMEVCINVLPDGIVRVGEKFYKPADLAAVLKRETASAGKGIERKVLIRGDREAHYGKIMRIMAACAEAGIWNVAFSTFDREAKAL